MTDEKKGGRSYHHGDLRTALLAAAGAMLERDGPEALSFRAIARASGVSQTAPYNHFRSKEDLLATLAGDGFRALAAAQASAAAAASPGQERIVALGLDYVGFALARPQLYRLMFGAGVSDWCDRPEVAEAKSASFLPIQEALAERLEAGPGGTAEKLETAAIAAWALVHGLSLLLVDGTLGSRRGAKDMPAELVEKVVTLLVEGLGDSGEEAAGPG